MEEKIYYILEKHKLSLKKREGIIKDLLNLFDSTGSDLLEDILSKQEEIICSPRRDVVITAESVKKVFEKFSIKWKAPF